MPVLDIITCMAKRNGKHDKAILIAVGRQM